MSINKHNTKPAELECRLKKFMPKQAKKTAMLTRQVISVSSTPRGEKSQDTDKIQICKSCYIITAEGLRSSPWERGEKRINHCLW